MFLHTAVWSWAESKRWTWALSSAYAVTHVTQVKNALALLPSPYLHNGLMVVINQTTQMVDSTGRPVPLSEVQPAGLSRFSMWLLQYTCNFTWRSNRAGGDVEFETWRARADRAGACRCTCTTTSARPPC